MKAKYNQKLRDIAGASVLHRSASIIFLCDSDLYICMKSIFTEKSIKKPITGASIAQYLDDSFTKQILAMEDGWIRGELFLNSSTMNVVVYAGELDGERYYAFTNESGMNQEEYGDISESIKNSIDELISSTGRIIDELLHCKTNSYEKLAMNDTRMIRLKRCIAVMLDEEHLQVRKLHNVSVTTLLDQICRACNDIVSAYGYQIIPEYSSTLRYCDCSTRMLAMLILTILYNVMSSSQHGNIYVNFKHNIYEKQLVIKISTDTRLKCTENSSGNFQKFAELLIESNVLPFIFELRVCAEIINSHGWWSVYDICDGKLTISLSLPETTSIRSVMSVHAESTDILFAQSMIADFSIDLIALDDDLT